MKRLSLNFDKKLLYAIGLAVVLVATLAYIYLPTLWFSFLLIALIGLVAAAALGSRKGKRGSAKETTPPGMLESIVTNLSDGVIAYNNNFEILVFNRAAEDIFRVKKTEVVGQKFGPERASEPKFKTLTQTMFPSLAPSVLRQSEAGAYPQVVDISFSSQELRVSTDRLIDITGGVIGFVKLIQDRTREVELMKSKSEFITIAAHQLRTPLTAINWIFEGFAKSDALPKDDKELAGNGLTATRKLLKIVNDLLDVSKIEEGRFGYNFEETNLIDFVSEILKNAQVVAKEYKINLYLDKGAEQRVMVTIDPNRLGLALSNLLDNAIRYNVENGSVTVGIKALTDKPYIEVSVADTGIGIPQENMDKVFSKFFRSENVVKIATEGSGLGLYITKNIINRHGGTIWAESILGRGTTFYFTLPTDPRLIPPKEFGMGV